MITLFASKAQLASKSQAPALLAQEITYTRSVIHHCVQASARAINEALGSDDPALVDEFLASELGKRWLQGFRDYAIHVLARSL